MLVDIAHASEAVIDDILELSTLPIVSSHTGVRGVCNNQRNLRDEHLKGIAATGGVVGVAYFEPAVCGDNILDSIVETVVYLKNLIGTEHIALGSDFDGTVRVPFDTSKLIYITDALMRKGFSNTEIGNLFPPFPPPFFFFLSSSFLCSANYGRKCSKSIAS